MKRIYSVNDSKEVLRTLEGLKSRITTYLPRVYHVIAPMLFLAFGLFGVNESAWGYWYANINVTASPSDGGNVYVGTSKSCSSNNCTTSTDNAGSGKQGGFFSTSGSYTFYLCNKPNGNYVFKGWAESADSNSGSGESDNPWSNTVSGSWPSSTHDYYAIFAKLTTNKSSLSFGNKNSKSGWGNAQTVKVTYVHAGTVTAQITGTDASDFSFSNTSASTTTTVVTDNTNTEDSKDITVYFNPSCNGTRTAKLTFSGNGMTKEVTLTGTGVLNGQTLSWDNEDDIELNMLVGSTQYISATATSGLKVSYSSNNGNVLTVGTDGKLTANSTNTGTATITATQVGDCEYGAATRITKTITVKSKDTPIFKPTDFAENSTCSLKVGEKVTMEVEHVSAGLNGDFTATATKANELNVLSITREGNIITIEAINAGNSTATFTQTENTTIFGATKNYSFSVSKHQTSFSGSAYNLMVDGVQTADYSWTNTSAAQPTASSNDDFYYTIDNVSFTNSAKNKGTDLVTFNPSNNKITACNAGTAKITLHQKETYKYTGATQSFNVAVYKYNSAFSGAANLGVKVEETKDASYTLTYSKPNNAYIGTVPVAGDPSLNSGNYYYSLTQNVTSDNTTGSADATIAAAYDAGTKKATGKNAGTCTVNLYQKENYKFNAAQTSFEVTVTKNDNTLYVNGNTSYHPTMYTDKKLNVTMTSTNTDYTNCPIVVSLASSGNNAELAYTQSTRTGVVSSNNQLGDETWNIHQDGNYKYKEANGSFKVTVAKASEATDCYVYQNAGSNSTTVANYKDGLNFGGVGEKLTFQMKKRGGGESAYYYTSSDGTNWSSANSISESSSSYQLHTITLPANTQYIKFAKGGLFGTDDPYIKDIKVTRKTWLNASDLTIDKTSAGSPVYPSDGTGVGSLEIDYSLANGGDLKILNDNSKFTLSENTISNVDCKTGTKTITIEYESATAGTDYAHLLIYNDAYRKEVTITGVTVKKTPTVTWSPDATIFNVGEELTATNGNGLTVSLSVAAADAAYVSCQDNMAVMTAEKKSGTVTVTAHVTGNQIYADADIEKVITITNKEKQSISWNQDFSRRKTNDATKSITLTATASSNLPVTYKLEGDATGLTLTQNGNTWTLTYSTSECKNTTIVAMQAGNDEYAPAPNFSLPVKVIDPTKECDVTTTLVNSDIELKYTEQTLNIDIPDEITINVKRTKTLGIYSNGFKVEFYDGKNGIGNKVGDTHSYGASDINTSKKITIKNLDRSIKSVKLISEALNGYTVTSVTYKQQKYCETDKNTLNFVTNPNTKPEMTFTVNYANYPISLECANTKFTISPKDFGDCGENGTQTVTVTYQAGASAGTDNGNILYIKDNTGAVLEKCTLNVTINKLSQGIESTNIANSYNTTDRVELSATTNSGLSNFTYSVSHSDVASVSGNVLTFSKSGTIAITINEAGNDVYKSCSTTVADVVVNKVTPTLTLPTGTGVTYLQNLSASTLSGGKATVTLRGVENTEVAGSFAWTNGTTQANGAAGNNSFEVTFTPTDKGMYNNATGMVTIAVEKANQTIVMNNGTVSVAVDKGLDANSADSKLDLTSLISAQTTDALDATRTGAVSFEVISSNSANATISGTIFSATAEGTYTIRATKAGTNYYNAATAEFTVSANVRANSLSIAGACTRYVDQEVTNVLSNVNSDATIQTNSTVATIAYYDIESNKIVIPNSEAKSFNDTVVTITIWQDATAQFAASGEKTINVTVKKYDNTLSCDWGTWSKNMQFDEGTYVHFSSSNTDTEKSPIVVEQVTGLENATYYPLTHELYASHNIGQATWSVSQAENYKYKAALTKTLTVNVNKIAMPTDCYVLNETAEQELFGVLGVGTGDPMELSAPGKDLYFDAKRDGMGANYFFIEYSTNGSQYTVLGDEVQLSASYKTYGPFELPEGTTHIRFKTTTGATLSKYYKNVHVTRKTAFDLEDKDGARIDTMEMPLNLVSLDPLNVNSSKKSFYVDFNTCADVIHVASNHSYYTVKEADKAFNTSATNGAGRREIEVTYTCASADSSSAVISVYTQYEHRTLIVNGRTDKGTQVIEWKEPDFVQDTVNLPIGYSGIAGSVSSYLPLTYSIDSLHSDMGVVSIADDAHSFAVVGLGTATLVVTQEGNETLYPVTGTRVINATTKKLQVIRWFQDLSNTLSKGDTVRLEAAVYVMNTKTSKYEKDEIRTGYIQYTHPEDTVIVLMGKDSLRVVGTGSTTLTASLPSEDSYVDAPSITMNINVHSVSDTCANKLLVDSKKQYTFEPSIDWGFSNLNLTQAEYGDTIQINQSIGKPDKLSFEHCGSAFTVVSKEYYQGYIKAQQHVRGAWVDVTGSRIAPTKGVWNESGDVQLDEEADAIRIMREENAYGTHYVKSVKVTMLPYLRAPESITINAEVGTMVDTTITVEYANAKSALEAKTGRKPNDTLSVRNMYFYSDCGSIGTYNWPIRFKSDKVGTWSDSITIKDAGRGDSVVVYVYANVTPGAVFVYENDTTSGSWGDDGNWSHGGDLPTANDHVLIKTDVIIPADTTVYVKSLSVEETATVYVNGTLVVMESTPDKEQYGNIHIKEQGTVDLSNITVGGLKVQDFILDAKLGDADNAAASGQLSDEKQKLVVMNDAYFQMSFDVSGQITYGWYDFVVPFEVDAKNGVFDANGVQIVYGTDYIIMSHSEEKRARNQKAWSTFTGTLEPGRIYTITFEETKTWNTFLFKKKDDSDLVNNGTYTSAYSSTIGESQDRGWNGFGNGTLQHRELTNLTGISKVQMYNHTYNRYDVVDDVDWSTKALAVGTAFSIQVLGEQSIVLTEADAEKPLRAPQMDNSRTIEEFYLTLTDSETAKTIDRLWVSASEDATGEYVIGRDLLKMGTPTQAKVAQMWAINNNLTLCDIEMPFVSEQASCALGLFAPKAGSYELMIERAPEDADLYLTYNDQVIWDLTASPYVFELAKGTTEGYGLRIVARAPQITTGVDETNADSKSVRKVVINDKIYMITPEGKMYDIVGKSVKY